MKIAILACSRGPEAYSALWTVHSCRPDLNIACVAVDLSASAIATAKAGTYALDSAELEGLSEAEFREIFILDHGQARVRPSLASGISWMIGDLREPGLLQGLGPQDIVLANNFLIHLSDAEAESCLRTVTEMVASDGHLFVWGVNPDLKTRVLGELGFEPDTSLLEEIYEADTMARRIWPFKYWGLEPMDRSRHNWSIRYATVFRRGRARGPTTP